MRPNLDAKVRHGGSVPSLWVTHRPRYEATARVPRVQALEAVFAKGAAGSVLSRKRSHVLLDDVAFHRERKVARQKMYTRVQACSTRGSRACQSYA